MSVRQHSELANQLILKLKTDIAFAVRIALMYSTDNNALTRYSDADWAGDANDCKSTSVLRFSQQKQST